MKVACVLLSDFEVAVELHRHPELVGRPVVVGGLPHERKVVRSCSPEAAACGIMEGMPLRKAVGLCPEAVFLPVDERLYQTVQAMVLETLDAFSPKVEATGGVGDGESGRRGDTEIPHSSPRTQNSELRTHHHSPLVVYLDASGLELLFGSDAELGERIAAAVEIRAGLHPQVGIGGSKFVAYMAAMMAAAGSVVVVGPGEEGPFLAPLPVEWLPSSQEMQRRLRLFGLRTMGQLAELPAGALGEQFGPEGVEAARLARGIDERPVIGRPDPAFLRERVEIDPPTDRSDLLIEAAGRLARRLEVRIRNEFLACREVTLDLGFVGGPTIRFSTVLHEPTDRAADLQRAAERLLGRVWARIAVSSQPSAISHQSSVVSHPSSTQNSELRTQDPAPRTTLPSLTLVSSLHLSVSEFGGHQGEQLELFGSRVVGLKKAQRAIKQAEELFGNGTIGPMTVVAREKPVARRIKVIAEVDGEPHVLFLDSKRERVREVSNRWRVQEEWWRRERMREYYRVITESGRLCLIFQDLLGGGWFLERVYD
ncbi:MAG: hypothetical protein M1380_07095 [Chloroflexi bacterium]|nr:hypothetical protein [Chloroflexota bacterium]